VKESGLCHIVPLGKERTDTDNMTTHRLVGIFIDELYSR